MTHRELAEPDGPSLTRTDATFTCQCCGFVFEGEALVCRRCDQALCLMEQQEYREGWADA